MTGVIEQIQKHLMEYREYHGIPFDHLSSDDISKLKGCVVRPVKVQEMDYKRGWAKLAKAQKLNRLMDYHKRLTSDYNLDVDQQGQLKSLFYDGISSDILNREKVVYNSNEGSITKIDGLKRDKKGLFFFDNEEQKPKNVKVQSVQRFKPITIQQISVATNKAKPVIKLKR
tara:strand:+ start:1461 stop:1973 length:513 start_codon:yes stop_codon:yes gene_type:complete